MRLSRIDDQIRLDFKYDPEIVAKLKNIPKARYQNNDIDAFWLVHVNYIKLLMLELGLSIGHLYPNCMDLIRAESFAGLQVELKRERLKLRGQNRQYMALCLQDLCSVKEIHVGQVIYDQNGTIVFQFAPGLYWRVLDFLRKCHVTPFIHSYPAPPAGTRVSIAIRSRPYQARAIEDIVNGKIPNRATLTMATGAGKTILSAMIAAELGLPTTFYTHSVDLLEQTAAVYEKVLRVKVGRIGGNNFSIEPVTIATVQTVYSCFERKDSRWEALSKYLKQVELMFVDEGHMLGAETVYTVANISSPYYAYALTATPEREDGKELLIEAATGPVFTIIEESELIEQGYVLPADINMIPIKHPPCKAKRYSTQYKRIIVDNQRRNKAICNVVNDYQDKQTIVLTKEIRHGKLLAEKIGCPFLSGASKDRQTVLKRFQTSKIKTLVASPILKQGVDLPEAEVLILAHGGKSLVELQQKIGRVRRPAPMKERGIVIDFYDSVDSGKDIFTKHADRRLSFYKKAGYKISWVF